MKATILTTLSMVGFSLASAADSFTLDSMFTLADGSTLSAYDAVVGKTVDTVNNYAYTASNGAGKAEASSKSLTLNLGEMYSSQTLSGTLNITSVTVVSRPDNTRQNTATMTLTVGNQTFTSGDAVYSTNAANTYGTVIYSFATPVEISADTTSLSLTITATETETITNQDGTTTTKPKKFGYGEFKVAEGCSLTSGSSTAYTPVVRLSGTYTPAVPEPATATLSLLALAGLAARRRRK